MDISGSGTPLGLGDDGEADIATTVGNSLLGAGTSKKSLFCEKVRRIGASLTGAGGVELGSEKRR